MNKILVPTDFSESSKYSLHFASQIASLTGSTIVLFHVVDYPGSMGAWTGGLNVIGGSEPPIDNIDEVFVKNLMDKAREEMASVIKESEGSELKLIQKVEIGNPYFCIAEEIRDEGIDLVIIGSKASTGIEEVLIGTTTEKVVRLSKCPVITIRQELDIKKIKNIIFASNFTEREDHVIEELMRIQSIFNATLHLVRINTPVNFQSNRVIMNEIESFVEKYKIQECTFNLYNDFTEEDGIIHFGEEINADMIALATHGRTGLLHLLSGSIAEDVVNHARRPVWTCRIKN